MYMASEKARQILWKIEAPFTQEQIAAMPEGQAWGLIRQHDRKLREIRERLRLPQICFTGFKNSDKGRLKKLATQAGFEVKDCVTKKLKILVIGDNRGPDKIAKANAQGCPVFTEDAFMDYLQTKKGE